MKVVVIYGPPAVGKLTVGKILQKRIGYKLLHNHLTYDLARSIFDDMDTLSEVNMNLRLYMIKEAAIRATEGLILTYVYASPIDDKHVKKLLDQAKQLATYYFQSN